MLFFMRSKKEEKPKPDVYSLYETGLSELMSQISNSKQYTEALVYQTRLLERIRAARLYGDTESNRAERNEIIARLDEIAVSELKVPFLKLCQSVTLKTDLSDPEPDPLSPHCILAYFDYRIEDAQRLYDASKETAKMDTAPIRSIQIHNPDHPDWTISLGLSGKVRCCSTKSYADAEECAKWLRMFISQKIGISPRVEAYGRIVKGQVELELTGIQSLERVSLAENLETIQALVSIGGSQVNWQAITAVLTEAAITDIIEELGIDGHNSRFHGLVIDTAAKERLLANLSTCAAAQIEARAARSLILMEALKTRYLLVGIAATAWGVALGVMGSAVFHYVVRPLVSVLVEGHMEDAPVQRKLDIDAMFSAFPTLSYLSTTTPHNLLELSKLTGQPTWAVMIQINQLRRKQIVLAQDSDVFLLASQPDYEKLSFAGSYFGEGAITRHSVQRYQSVLEGIDVERASTKEDHRA